MGQNDKVTTKSDPKSDFMHATSTKLTEFPLADQVVMLKTFKEVVQRNIATEDTKVEEASKYVTATKQSLQEL